MLNLWKIKLARWLLKWPCLNSIISTASRVTVIAEAEDTSTLATDSAIRDYLYLNG